MRICDLAKELMTTGKELLALLQARGCTARSTQANLTPDLEQYLRDEIKRIYYGAAAAPAPAAEAAAPEAAPAAPAAEAAVETAPEAPAEAAAPEAAPAPAEEPAPAKVVAIKGHVVVKEFADLLGIKPNVLIAKLMRQGIFASIAMKIDFKAAEQIAKDLGFVLEHEKKAAPRRRRSRWNPSRKARAKTPRTICSRARPS